MASAIRFKPLIVGAWVNWAAAIGIFIVDSFRYDMMISAVAVLVGYLIPGYMLRAEPQEKDADNRQNHCLMEFKDLDPILHSQLRLAVVSLLISVKEAEFTFIKERQMPRRVTSAYRSIS